MHTSYSRIKYVGYTVPDDVGASDSEAQAYREPKILDLHPARDVCYNDIRVFFYQQIIDTEKI